MENKLQRLEELRKKARLAELQARVENAGIEDDDSDAPGVLETMLRRFTNSATAGLAKPVIAAGSNTADTLIDAASGQMPENTFKEAYDYETAQDEAGTEAHPIAATVGDLAGLISPGGAYSRLSKSIKEVPALAKLASQPSFIKKLIAMGAENVGANTIYGQLDEDFDATLDERKDRALMDAETGLATAGLGATIARTAEGLSSVPKKLMNKAIGTTSKQVEKGRDIGQKLVDRGVAGTSEGLLSKAQSKLTQYEDELQNLLSKADDAGAIDNNVILKELAGMKSEYTKPGWEAFAKQADDLMQEFSSNPLYKNMKASDANKLKRFIYEKLGDSAYLADKLPGFKESQKTLARGLKKAIEKSVPEAGKINEELAVYGGLSKAMKKIISKADTPSKMNNALRLISALTSGGVGFGVGGPVGAGAAMLASEAAQTTIGKTGTAQTVKYLSKLLGKTADKTKYLAPAISKASQ